jgi:hypothetical protein
LKAEEGHPARTSHHESSVSTYSKTHSHVCIYSARQCLIKSALEAVPRASIRMYEVLGTDSQDRDVRLLHRLPPADALQAYEEKKAADKSFKFTCNQMAQSRGNCAGETGQAEQVLVGEGSCKDPIIW